ncbi:MAG: beta-lactamase family protein [Oscillospiraceae bacterium]|nr:beta-lactamase family protein [Oscillospiraceae bacterium]
MKYLNSEKLNRNLKKNAERDLEEKKLFGVSYWVMQAGTTVSKHCFGTADGITPLQNDHLFRLASMTKPITALATLILVGKGRLSLSARADLYVPSLAGITLAKEKLHPQTPITVRHLLSHTSGLKICAVSAKDRETAAGTIARSVRAGLEFEPGTQQAYNSYVAFDVLGEIIAAVSGTTLPDFLEREIFHPLGMNDTCFSPSEEQWGRMVALHDRIDGENCIGKTVSGCVFEGFPHTHPLAGGGLVSTLEDYGKFAKCLLADGAGLVSGDLFSQLRTPQVSESVMPGSERWGLGVRVITAEDAALPLGSFGWSGAYGTHFWVDPENQIIAIMMKNSRVDGGADNQSARNFEHAVYDAI